MNDFFDYGNITYYRARGHSEPEEINCGKLFFPKRAFREGTNQYGEVITIEIAQQLTIVGSTSFDK